MLHLLHDQPVVRRPDPAPSSGGDHPVIGPGRQLPIDVVSGRNSEHRICRFLGVRTTGAGQAVRPGMDQGAGRGRR